MNHLLNKLESIGAMADKRYDKETISIELADELDVTILADYLNSAKSTHQLEALLQTRSNLVCGLQPADVPDEEPGEEPDEDEESEKKQVNAWHKVA